MKNIENLPGQIC